MGKKKNIGLALVILVLVTIIASFIVFIKADKLGYFDKDYLFKEYESCEGLDLVNHAECLRQEVAKIYSFNLTDDEISLSYEQLVEHGGDCRNWAFYYQDIYDSENFYGTTKSFKIMEGTQHRVFILSDETGYCILDQTQYPKCNKVNQDYGDN